MSDDEQQDLDPKFFERADAHIYLSNDQLADVNPGKASASMMYATARFNAYVSWIGFKSGSEMAAEREKTVNFFVEQNTIMLKENLDDYIQRFDEYRQTAGGTHPDDK
ncbi:MAG: DUF3144 domain-containing protein [Acidobacteriota bacterium]